MNVETIKELEEQLHRMSVQELNRFTRQCVCQKIHANQHDFSDQFDPNVTLDLIHTEYLQRGLEKHYDMAYDFAAKNPDVCSAA